MNVPDYWFWLSAIFFFLGIVIMVGQIVLGVVIFRLIKEVKPKVDAMEQKVNETVEKVQAVSAKVEALVDHVGTRARGVSDSVELVAHSASRQFERFSPILIGALTAIRIFTALRESRKPREQKIAEKAAEQAIERSHNSHISLGKILGSILKLATSR